MANFIQAIIFLASITPLNLRFDFSAIIQTHQSSCYAMGICMCIADIPHGLFFFQSADWNPGDDFFMLITSQRWVAGQTVEMEDGLATDYDLETTIEGREIYRRRSRVVFHD